MPPKPSEHSTATNLDDRRRHFPDMETFRKGVSPVLAVILAAREPLPVDIIQRLWNWQDAELRDFIRSIGPLFRVAAENGIEVVCKQQPSYTCRTRD